MFVKGQLVKCVNGKGRGDITEGKYYSVYSIVFEDVTIGIFDDNGFLSYAAISRFDCVNATCVNSDDSQLVRERVYEVYQIKNDLIRLKDFPYWYSLSRFEGEFPEKNVVVDNRPLLDILKKKVGNDPGVCSYAVKFDKGDTKYHVRDVCHARIAFGFEYVYRGKKLALEIAFNVSGHYYKMPVELKEAYKKYVNYIVNESPFSSVFIGNKNIDFVLSNGVTADVNRTISEVACSAVALRVGSEFDEILPPFSLMIDKGFNPHVSYLVATLLSPKAGGWEVRNKNGGHYVLKGSMCWEHLKKFFKTGEFINQKGQLPYKDSYQKQYKIYDSIAECELANSVFELVNNPPIPNHREVGMWGQKEKTHIIENEEKLYELASYVQEEFNK